MKFKTSSKEKRLRVEVTGVVQGVGFRPYVYNLARSLGLRGFVMNASSGLILEVEGDKTEAFLKNIRTTPPPLAVIMTFHEAEITYRGDRDFLILPSLDRGDSTHLSPDIATCDDCLRELMDPGDRRYLYPFINCTNCGPRYTITQSVPYDRPHTTMACFSLCHACRKEYNTPSDRRFHAQPNACSACGPGLELLVSGRRILGRDALGASIQILKEGKILAVKGLGGFHLAADGENSAAVTLLRQRKRKNNKAFALMAPDMVHVRHYCTVSEGEENLLLSKERPIVLLRKRADVTLHEEIAPGLADLGFMLPCTPLHALLFFFPLEGTHSGSPNFKALIMTSGNRREEPIVQEDREAEEKLSGLADAILFHDREIFMRVDDSVVRHIKGNPHVIRRSRGYVPSSISLGSDGPQVLACGADLKNTFTLTRGDAAIVSQHMGDMENDETVSFFEETLENLKSVYRISPEAIAHDLHPAYFSTRWAQAQSKIRKQGVQHHYAHAASVMAENGLRGKILGVILDGSGYGPDGTVWGGEFLVADLNGFDRAARFRPLPLPGGESGIRNPWMMAVSVLKAARGGLAFSDLETLGYVERYGGEQIENIFKIMGNRSISPLTSSAGRLFDALSSLLGLRDINTYEGEAAMALEALALPNRNDHYPYHISAGEPAEIDFSEALHPLLNDIAKKENATLVSTRFHNTVAEAVIEMIRNIHGKTGIKDVALSGGVFQNRILFNKIKTGAEHAGLAVYTNRKVPCNDGGISLGQAYLLREWIKKGE